MGCILRFLSDPKESRLRIRLIPVDVWEYNEEKYHVLKLFFFAFNRGLAADALSETLMRRRTLLLAYYYWLLCILRLRGKKPRAQ